MTTFDQLLTEQIGHEFAASQQYIAIAVWFDDRDLPQLARHFYRQAVEERNHAMMLIQYRLDRDMGVTVPGVDAPRTDFADHAEPIRLSLEQEKRVSAQIEAQLREGVVSQLEVFETERSLLNAQLQLLAVHQQILADTVTLYKALGGGWPDTEVRNTAASQPQ